MHTMMSNRPSSFTAISTAAFTSASLPTLAITANAFTFGKRFVIRTAPFCAASRLISTRRTLAPSCAKRMDDSNPIPLFQNDNMISSNPYVRCPITDDPAPVTTATWRKRHVIKKPDSILSKLNIPYSEDVQAYWSIRDESKHKSDNDNKRFRVA
jgi:hypothetical protein